MSRLPLLALVCFAAACSRPAGVEEARPLSTLRVDQFPEYPGGLPAAWADSFDHAMRQSPQVEPGAPGALAQVRSAFLSIPWIQPESVVVEGAMPEGFRVRFAPRRPRLVLTRGERPVGVLSTDGIMLPQGLSEEQMAGLLRTPLPADADLPAVGTRPANPDLQEAMRLWAEADTVADLMKLPIVAIARQSHYPAHADQFAPAMSFLLADGTEICWGRSELAKDAFAVDERGRPLTMERKLMRLKGVWQEYPDLQGIGRVVLDFPALHLYDERERELPAAASMR